MGIRKLTGKIFNLKNSVEINYNLKIGKIPLNLKIRGKICLN